MWMIKQKKPWPCTITIREKTVGSLPLFYRSRAPNFNQTSLYSVSMEFVNCYSTAYCVLWFLSNIFGRTTFLIVVFVFCHLPLNSPFATCAHIYLAGFIEGYFYKFATDAREFFFILPNMQMRIDADTKGRLQKKLKASHDHRSIFIAVDVSQRKKLNRHPFTIWQHASFF